MTHPDPDSRDALLRSAVARLHASAALDDAMERLVDEWSQSEQTARGLRFLARRTLRGPCGTATG